MRRSPRRPTPRPWRSSHRTFNASPAKASLATCRPINAAARLTHNDLGMVHILAEAGRISGIIDWSDACLGDPAKDFVGVLGAGGWPAIRATLATYGPMPPDFEDRIGFFAWVAPIHDILYGLRTGQPEHVRDGIEGVAARMRLAGVLPAPSVDGDRPQP